MDFKDYQTKAVKTLVNAEDVKKRFSKLNLDHINDSFKDLVKVTNTLDVYKKRVYYGKGQQTIKPDFSAFESFCNKHEFKSIIKDMDKWRNIFEKSRLLEILGNLPY